MVCCVRTLVVHHSKRATLAAGLLLALSQCKCSKPLSEPVDQAQGAPELEGAPGPRGLRQVTFLGACDASGAVALDKKTFVVADDEDNILRLYDATKGGEPLSSIDLSSVLELRKKHPESDIEAATRIGDVAYWLTSHGRNKKGALKPERFFFFATSLPVEGQPLASIGTPQDNLQEQLIAHFDAEFSLRKASALPPNVAGGFNMEGMTATPDNRLLIGFRNPIPRGSALIVSLENPREVMDGVAPRFGKPTLLDLGGLGIRGLSWWHGKYLISGGPYADGPSKLFTWDGTSERADEIDIDLRGFNPEGFFTPEDADEIMVLSDDGTRRIDGTPCKALERGDGVKRFRGVWLRPF